MRTPPSVREVLALAGLVSACSLVYELVIAASFVAMTGDSVFWQSLTIGIYLAAVGVGTYACSRAAPKEPWETLFAVELGLSLLGMLAVGAILGLETGYRLWLDFQASADPPEAPYIALLVLCHGFTVAIGFLSGFELPLLLRGAERASDGRGRFQWVLGANYFGALAGGLAFSFLLLPRLGLPAIALLASGTNLAACLLMMKAGWVGSARPRRLGAAAAGALILLMGGAFPLLERLNLVSFYARRLGVVNEVLDESPSCCGPDMRLALDALWSRTRQVERIPSPYQRIDLLTTAFKPTPLRLHYNRRPLAEPGPPYGLYLYMDRRFQFYGGTEALYHEFLAHVPVQIFRRRPQDVLILGGGDGLLARELLKYPSVRSVTNVELDPVMARLAKEDPRLRLLNGHSFHDPRVRVLVEDAFFFVRNERRLYDAVYIDFPHPYNYDVAKLYSVEFLRNVARLLAPGGFAATDYPMVSLHAPEDELTPEARRRNSILVNTLLEAGFRTIVPYGTELPEALPRHEADLINPRPSDPDLDPEADRLLRRVEVLRYRRRHPGLAPGDPDALGLVDNRVGRETMLAFTQDRPALNFRFQDHGIPLHSLNARRLAILEGGRYPYKDDRSLANTVFRPRLFKPFHADVGVE